jgi:hypothetical protein
MTTVFDSNFEPGNTWGHEPLPRTRLPQRCLAALGGDLDLQWKVVEGQHFATNADLPEVMRAAIERLITEGWISKRRRVLVSASSDVTA